MMKAAVLYNPGEWHSFILEEREVPIPKQGWVLLRCEHLFSTARRNITYTRWHFIQRNAAQMAKNAGLQVITTTRNKEKQQLLLDNGADEIIIDDGKIEDKLKFIRPQVVDKVCYSGYSMRYRL